MRKIFEGNYKKLDDDVSFQILRTNPRLTTNTKLMYDGEKMYLESYDVDDLMASKRYKNKRIWKSGLFNNDIKNFLLDAKDSAYLVGSKMANNIVGDDYALQYENMYWCGSENIKSYEYEQEFGIIAPLYLRRKLPRYFIVFKLDGPSNFIMKKDVDDIDGDGNRTEFIDDKYDFKEDILNKATIVKTFDLREGTPIGDYIRRYVSQNSFEFDKSMYVNFSSKNIYYYGIDKNTGILTTKVEKFEDELLNNDNTIIHSDDWFTDGYKRNNLIYPYIINFEFLFDDNEIQDYKFCRYFGYYCDDIDLYEFDKEDDKCLIDKDYHYYIKDKHNNLHCAQKFAMTIQSEENNENIKYYNFFETHHYEHFENKGNKISEHDFELHDIDYFRFDTTFNDSLNIGDNGENVTYLSMLNKPKFISDKSKYNDKKTDHEINKNDICVTGKYDNFNDFKGYNLNSISAYCDYEDGYGYSTYMFIINKQLEHGDSITLCSHDDEKEDNKLSFYADSLKISGKKSFQERASNSIVGNRFSCTGDINTTAKNLCDCINNFDIRYNLFKAYSYNNIVVIKYLKYGEIYNDKLYVEFSTGFNNKIEKINMRSDNHFSGGTDDDGCLFKVRVDDINYFIGEKNNRYIKTPDGYDDAKIISYVYNIDEFGDTDVEYCIIYTDKNGKYVKISDIKQVEILEKFFPKFGVISFYPVKDFDFDTIYSSYCDDRAFENEINEFLTEEDVDYDDNDSEDILNILKNSIVSGRLFNSNGRKLISEYDYYYENMIPQLCTISKNPCHISKWGYVDGMDSCENPYRLNCSKIFGEDNLSANLYTYKGDKKHFTHELPYYIYPISKYGIEKINHYQYIPSLEYTSISYNDTVKKWTKLFSDESINYFDKCFRLTEDKLNKRHSKRYSKTKFGDSYRNAETLFRGVKFNILELKKDAEKYKQIKSAKYNNYDFSLIYIPCYDSNNLYFNNSVYFVKNDKFKFIVGFIVCNMIYLSSRLNKSLLYSACNNTIKFKFKEDIKRVLHVSSNSKGDIKININVDFNESFSYKIYNNVYSLKELYITSPLIRSIIYSTYKMNISFVIDSLEINEGKNKYVLYDSNEILLDGYTINIDSLKNGTEFVKTSNDKISVNISIIIKSDDVIKLYNKNNNGRVSGKLTYNDSGIETLSQPSEFKPSEIISRYKNKVTETIFSDLSQVYNSLSARDIKENINNGIKVHYNTDDFKIYVEEPVSIETYDLFKGNYTGSTVEVKTKSDAFDLKKVSLNRYSGYYQPIFKDILFFGDMKIDDELLKYTNVKFEYNYEDYEGKFGVINNMFFHKINEDLGSSLLPSLDAYYPLNGNYALEYDDYNIYSSNWDMNYYTKHKDAVHYEKCNYIASVDNNLCMFGGKYMNVPEIIVLNSFDKAEEWNDDYVMNPESCDSEAMYKEVDDTVDYCLFIKKRLMRYFYKDIKNVRDEITKYVSEEYSYGLKNTLDDDIEEYIKRNILDLYTIKSIEVYVKQEKRGLLDEYIENDYSKYMRYNVDDLSKYYGFKRTNTFRVSNVNLEELDKKVTYRLNKGMQEYFSFRVILIKK